MPIKSLQYKCEYNKFSKGGKTQDTRRHADWKTKKTSFNTVLIIRKKLTKISKLN